MWFLSGFVMIYHGFPKFSSQDRLAMHQAIEGHLRGTNSLKVVLPDSAKISGLSLEMQSGRPVFLLRGKGLPAQIYADSLTVTSSVNMQDIEQIVRRVNIAPILQIDTLYESDQWLMPRRLTPDKPVLKYYFGDSAKHQLYVSIHDGNVLQYTDRDQRFWAWLGAIPHWVYFTSLRQNHSLWMDFVIWTSGIGSLMCLLGLILGLRIFWRSKKQGFKVPYKKWWHKWHYISGMIFGLFALTFAFSGLMSMTSLPSWLIKKPKTDKTELSNPKNTRRYKELDLSTYQLDYRLLGQEFNDIKKIEWGSFHDSPLYKVYTDDKTWHIDASDSLVVKPFVLTQELVRESLSAQIGDKISYKLDIINQEDEYYFARKKERLSFPVYRVILDDELNTRYYYSPKTLSIQRIDDNTLLRRFLYNGLHSLSFKFLTDRPWLWNIAMFTLMIGGTFLSFTGVGLSLRWLLRKLKKYTNQRRNK